MTVLRIFGSQGAIKRQYRVQYNDELLTLDLPAFGDTIDGSLHIVGNQSLTSIASLASVTDLKGGLYIGKNEELLSLTGLANITEVGNVLSISNNGSIEDLKGPWLPASQHRQQLTKTESWFRSLVSSSYRALAVLNDAE